MGRIGPGYGPQTTHRDHELRDRHPGLWIEPVEIEIDPAERLLLEAHVDLALSYHHPLMPRSDRPTGIRRVHLLEDPMLVALPAGHRLARRDRIDLMELADEGWVQGRGGSATQLAERACLLAG